MDVEQQLRDALHEGAAGVDLHGRGPAAARGGEVAGSFIAGALVPAAVTVAMVGATAVVVWPRPDGAKPTIEAGAGSSNPAATPGDQKFDWQGSSSDVVDTRTVFTGSDGAYYALSTAPGARAQDSPDGAVPQAVYRSTDGTHWQPTSAGDAPWITDLHQRNGVLYALGTAPGSTDSVQPVVGTSTDGGAHWSKTNLPTTAQPPAGATIPIDTAGIQPSFAVRGDTIVTTVNTTFSFDPNVVLTPSEVASGMVASIGDNGIDVYKYDGTLDGAVTDPSRFGGGCFKIVAPSAAPAQTLGKCGGTPTLVRTEPWSTIGLSGPDDLRVSEEFRSTDGKTWHAEASPLPGFGSVQVFATPDGFIASGAKYDATVGRIRESALARSNDGTSWHSVTANLSRVWHVGVVGDRLVALLDQPGFGAQVAISDDSGTTWQTTDLGALATAGNGGQVSVVGFDTGPLGIAVALNVAVPGITLSNGTTGTAPPENHQTQVLLTSPDGASWTITPLAEIEGTANVDSASSVIEWVAVGTDNVLVTATNQSAPAVHDRSITYVGTPVAS